MIFTGSGTNRKSLFTPEVGFSQAMAIEEMFQGSDETVQKVMAESFCAVYHGMCAEDRAIVQEGLGDMAKSVYNFFKNLLKKFINFVKNTFNYLASYVGDFEKFINKYKDNMTKFKPFEVSGYSYTIDTSKIDRFGIDKLVNVYNTNVGKVTQMGGDEFAEFLKKELNKDKIAEMRGKVLGMDKSIRESRYDEELKKRYRDGKSSKHNIKVDSTYVSNIIGEYKTLKEAIDELKDEANNVEATINDFADFFKSMPQYEYSDGGSKRMKKHRISDGGDHGDIKDDGDEDYSNDSYRRLVAYYNFCFKVSKEVLGAYTKAYNAKIGAIKEALSFYRGVIRSALSPFASKEKDDAVKESLIITDMEGVSGSGEDYAATMEGASQEIAFEEYCGKFNEYMLETKIFGDAFLFGRTVVTEDVTINHDKDDQGIFAKIVEFIKKVISKFIEKGKSLFKSNTKWFEENAHRFDNITDEQYNKMKITMIPYENTKGYAVMKPKIRDNDDRLKNAKDEMEIHKLMYPDLINNSQSRDIVEGAKKFYRGGSNDVKEYTGPAVKAHVDGMIRFCQEYNATINRLQDESEQITKSIEKAQDQISKVVNESAYSLVEGCLLSDTVFDAMSFVNTNGEIVLEKSQKNTGGADKEDKPNLKPNVTMVDGKGNVTNPTEKAKTPEEQERDAKKSKVNGATNVRIYYSTMAKVLTCAMTVCEERYHANLSTLKSILGTVGAIDKKPEEAKK